MDTDLKKSLNGLLGGRGWWLVKGALVRGPFLFPFYERLALPEFFFYFCPLQVYAIQHSP